MTNISNTEEEKQVLKVSDLKEDGVAGLFVSSPKRFELLRGNPMYLAGTRLNHSAKATSVTWNLCIHITPRPPDDDIALPPTSYPLALTLSSLQFAENLAKSGRQRQGKGEGTGTFT